MFIADITQYLTTESSGYQSWVPYISGPVDNFICGVWFEDYVTLVE